MLAWLRGLLQHGLVQNVLALYGVQAANYLFPLLTLPYLTRVLGPVSWGLLAMVQSFAQYLALLVEYGFNLSATREVARHRDDRSHLASLLAGVTGAKGVLSGLTIFLALAAYEWIPNFRDSAALLASGCFGRWPGVIAQRGFSKGLNACARWLCWSCQPRLWPWCSFFGGCGARMTPGRFFSYRGLPRS